MKNKTRMYVKYTVLKTYDYDADGEELEKMKKKLFSHGEQSVEQAYKVGHNQQVEVVGYGFFDDVSKELKK